MRRLLVCLVALVLAPAAHAETTAISLTGPARAAYGKPVQLRGAVQPAELAVPVTLLRDGTPVGSTVTARDGTFVFRVRPERPGRYEASVGQILSNAVAPLIRPRLRARVVGAKLVRRPLRLLAGLEPAQAGTIVVRIWRNGRLTRVRRFAGSARVGLGTSRAASFRIRVTVEPNEGYTSRYRALRASVVHPRLSLGSRGPSVLLLEQGLRRLGFALPSADGLYGLDSYQAVLAFQKVRGLPWTGRVDARVWRALNAAHRPTPRYRGNHVEVSKSRQVLYLVRGGRVQLVVHVSTGATGNTPVGRWRVYRKVAGWSWVLWYPSYFLRGFAIHGYPSVPAYPASHGCVRVPMWIAPRLYTAIGYGESVYVY